MLSDKLNATVKHSDGSESPIFEEYNGKEEIDDVLAL